MRNICLLFDFLKEKRILLNQNLSILTSDFVNGTSGKNSRKHIKYWNKISIMSIWISMNPKIINKHYDQFQDLVNLLRALSQFFFWFTLRNGYHLITLRYGYILSHFVIDSNCMICGLLYLFCKSCKISML